MARNETLLLAARVRERLLSIHAQGGRYAVAEHANITEAVEVLDALVALNAAAPGPATAPYGPPDLQAGERVVKDKGDYTFEGQVLAVIHKRSGAVRYVVENDAGIVHIFAGTQLRRAFATEQEPDE